MGMHPKRNSKNTQNKNLIGPVEEIGKSTIVVKDFNIYSQQMMENLA